MWNYPPPWMYPPMYGSPQQGQTDPVKLAKAWKKFLKEEKKEVKQENKTRSWTSWEVGLFLTVCGPFVGLIYAWAFLTLAEHIATMIHP